MSSYSEKRRARLQQAALTSGVAAAQQAAVTPVQAAKPAPIEATTFAECMATYGLPYVVTLGDESTGETLVTLVRTVVRMGDNDADVVKVIAVSDDYISEGFYVFSGEVARLAAAGVDYMKDEERSEWAEANRFKLFTITTELIKGEGGHREFGQKVDALRKERIIRADMKSGKLSSDVLNIARGPGLVGVETPSGHPVVLEVYRHGSGKRSKLYVMLLDAPFGVPQNLFRIGVYAPVSELFSIKERPQFAAEFSAFVVGLVPEDKKEEFRQMVDDLADSEVLKISQEIKSVNVRAVGSDADDVESAMPPQPDSVPLPMVPTVQ